ALAEMISYSLSPKASLTSYPKPQVPVFILPQITEMHADQNRQKIQPIICGYLLLGAYASGILQLNYF
ncbi:MAG: hypothetical protein EA341_01020, partial [Mongoliibacter sp.]|uniref:hypothetical protein n=1 Tax=Mongoliibacter sp. TaxID=2022438 RepID=UPI0012F2694A